MHSSYSTLCACSGLCAPSLSCIVFVLRAVLKVTHSSCVGPWVGQMSNYIDKWDMQTTWLGQNDLFPPHRLLGSTGVAPPARQRVIPGLRVEVTGNACLEKEFEAFQWTVASWGWPSGPEPPGCHGGAAIRRSGGFAIFFLCFCMTKEAIFGVDAVYWEEGRGCLSQQVTDCPFSC